MQCRSCGTTLTIQDQVADFGPQRLPGYTDAREPELTLAYPLTLRECPVCYLLQLTEQAPVDLADHIPDAGSDPDYAAAAEADSLGIVGYADRVHSYAARIHGNLGRLVQWVDISWDPWHELGLLVPDICHRTLVSPLLSQEAVAYPLRKAADRMIPDHFGSHYFDPGWADIITSAGSLGTVADLNEHVAGIARVLEPVRGLWVIQEPYAYAMYLARAADAITHEQLSYFTVTALRTLLERHGLEINDVTYSGLMGGCVRLAVSHKQRRAVSASVLDALDAERQAKIAGGSVTATGESEDVPVWRAWLEDAYHRIGVTRKIINQACSRGETVMAYGTGARSGMLLQLAGVDQRVIPFAVDADPERAGLAMASTGIQIVGRERLAQGTGASGRPHYVVAAPWYYRELITSREQDYLQSGGKLVFPFPECEVVSFE